MNRGKFIVFEGLDGCGKTSQLTHLVQKLSDLCATRHIIETREPGDSLPGMLCRGVSKRTVVIEQETEALLYAADRYEHIVKEVLPHLERGDHVICDRYYFSNFAYQTLTCDLEHLLGYNRRPMELCKPDVTLFIDVSPEECERRRGKNRASEELYEKVEKARVIRENYFAAFDRLKDTERVEVIDGHGTFEETAEKIMQLLTETVFTKEDLQ